MVLSMHLRKANNDPSMHFRKTNTDLLLPVLSSTHNFINNFTSVFTASFNPDITTNLLRHNKGNDQGIVIFFQQIGIGIDLWSQLMYK